MSKKKKIVVLSCMIALLAVTAVFNFVLSGKNTYSEKTATTFSEYRTERLNTRNEQMLELDRIVNESEDNSSVKQDALSQKMQLTKITEEELKMETLIKAYGCDEVVVTMSLNSPNVNVIIKDENFDQAYAMKIYNLFVQEGDIDCENINIIPYL